MEEYLCTREGYTFSRESDENDEIYLELSDLMKVRTFTKRREDSTEAQIQLVCTKNQPLLAILTGFYTTLVVNVISWNKAYAIYPRPSFIDHKTYLLIKMNDCFGKLLMKYEKRGWRSQNLVWPEDEHLHGSMLGNRRVGDRHTWMIPLDITGVHHPTTPDSVLEYSCFCLDKRENDDSSGPLGYYDTTALQFVSLNLKWKYSCAWDMNGRSSYWLQFAGPRLERLTLLELYKTPVRQRPRMIQEEIDKMERSQQEFVRFCLCDAALARSSLELPGYDSEIPKWYAEWEGQQCQVPMEL